MLVTFPNGRTPGRRHRRGVGRRRASTSAIASSVRRSARARSARPRLPGRDARRSRSPRRRASRWCATSRRAKSGGASRCRDTRRPTLCARKPIAHRAAWRTLQRGDRLAIGGVELRRAPSAAARLGAAARAQRRLAGHRAALRRCVDAADRRHRQGRGAVARCRRSICGRSSSSRSRITAAPRLESASFIDHLRPAVALIGVGRAQPLRPPGPSAVIDRLHDRRRARVPHRSGWADRRDHGRSNDSRWRRSPGHGGDQKLATKAQRHEGRTNDDQDCHARCPPWSKRSRLRSWMRLSRCTRELGPGLTGVAFMPTALTHRTRESVDSVRTRAAKCCCTTRGGRCECTVSIWSLAEQ